MLSIFHRMDMIPTSRRFMKIQGAYTALVTPFRNGEVDEESFRKLIESQIAAGIDGIVPVGTTGESPTLSFEEHLRVIELAVQISRKRVPVWAGTGSNSTKEAVYLTQEAEKLGADGSLLVAPYYNKPSPAGMFAHFSEIAQATKLPLMLYSVPGRCGIEIAVETVAALAKQYPNVVSIKEAGGTPERVSLLRAALPDSFAIMSGDDSMTLPFLSVGAVGVVSVASNLIPKEVGDLVKLFRAGKIVEAEILHRRLYGVFKDLFIESNPVPVKVALARAGEITEEVRLPLAPIQPGNREKLLKTLQAARV